MYDRADSDGGPNRYVTASYSKIASTTTKNTADANSAAMRRAGLGGGARRRALLVFGTALFFDEITLGGEVGSADDATVPPEVAADAGLARFMTPLDDVTVHIMPQVVPTYWSDNIYACYYEYRVSMIDGTTTA